MTISGLQKLTLLDYPGKAACIVFTRDCNFRCPFCHNAALVVGDPSAEEIDEESVIRYLEKRKNLLEGVCITGGEPLLQKDLADFIRRVRSLGYAVKLDTNGSFPDALRALLAEGLVDYVAMDIKNSPDAYGVTTGTCNTALLDRVRESIELIMTSGVDYEFRTTAVKGLHTEESLRGAFSMIRGAKRYFIQNFSDSGSLIQGEGLSPFSKDELLGFLSIAKTYVAEAALRGID